MKKNVTGNDSRFLKSDLLDAPVTDIFVHVGEAQKF